MTLKDYMQRIRETDDSDTVFSKVQSDKTKIIPPENEVLEDKKKIVLNIKIGKKKENTLTLTDKEKELFLISNTDEEKRDIWVEYYRKAVRSKKDNFYVSAMRQGLFKITEKNKVAILLNLDNGSTSTEILSKKWF